MFPLLFPRRSPWRSESDSNFTCKLQDEEFGSRRCVVLGSVLVWAEARGSTRGSNDLVFLIKFLEDCHNLFLSWVIFRQKFIYIPCRFLYKSQAHITGRWTSILRCNSDIDESLWSTVFVEIQSYFSIENIVYNFPVRINANSIQPTNWDGACGLCKWYNRASPLLPATV